MASARLGWLLVLGVVAATSAQATEDPFPDAKALVKQWDVEWTVEPYAQRSVVKVSQDILVRDPLGTEASNQLIVYYATKTELAKFDAKTIHADGQVVAVPSSLRLDRPYYKAGSTEYRATQFTFPDVQPGSVLHYEYELRVAEGVFRMPVEGGWWELQGDLPVLSAKLTVRVKDDRWEWQPHTATIVPFDSWCNAGDIKDSGHFSYQISCRDVPAFESEPMAPPDNDLRARVFIYAWPTNEEQHSLNAIASYYGRPIGAVLAQSRKLDEIAAQWKVSTLTPTQQLEEVMKWVRKNISLTTQGSESLDIVLERKAGDPWERNLVALGLMRAVGIVARPALLADRTAKGFHPDVPDASPLGHLFIAVGKTELGKFLDVNCEYCVPGVPPWQYLGPGSGGLILEPPNALVLMLSQVLPNTTTYTAPTVAKTDGLPAKYNSEIRRRTIALDPTGAAKIKGSITWQMQQDVDKRELWSALTPAGRKQDCIGYLPVEVEDAAVVTGDPANTQDYLTCSYEFQVPDAAFRLGTKLLVPGIDDFSAAIQLPVQAERRHPVRWHYARSVQSDVTYTLPPGATIAALPEATTLKGPEGITFQAHWLRTDKDNEVRLRGQLLVDKPGLAPEDIEATRNFISAMRSYLNSGIEVQVAP